MKFARSILLSAVTTALLFIPQVRAAPPAQPDQVQMRFEIFGFAGLHLLTNRTTVETSGTGYAITMNFTTRGLVGVFVDLDSHSDVRGTFADDRPQPRQFVSQTRRGGVDRRTRVDYGSDGVILKASTSPAVERANFVPAGEARRTVDQLTAYFIVERELAQRHSCAGTIPVFDGRLRYDLQFSDAPRQVLRGALGRAFPGPLWVCNMRRKEIAGFKDREEEASRGRIWYAWFAPLGRTVPVQMDFQTELGPVTGYLAEIRSPGVSLHLAQ